MTDEADAPDAMMEQAAELFSSGLPLRAEIVLREAIQTYRNRNDRPGLAEAYRQYAFSFGPRPSGATPT